MRDAAVPDAAAEPEHEAAEPEHVEQDMTVFLTMPPKYIRGVLTHTPPLELADGWRHG